MTLEGPDGSRYLVRRDGSLVTDDRQVRMDELTPESRRIVEALIAAKRSAEEAPGRNRGSDEGIRAGIRRPK